MRPYESRNYTFIQADKLHECLKKWGAVREPVNEHTDHIVNKCVFLRKNKTWCLIEYQVDEQATVSTNNSGIIEAMSKTFLN